MKCIYCNTNLAAIDYCPGCGADITLLKRIARISNLLYNRALEKATVRDLSGAVSLLQRSLKFNKENIDARNLLGLCYYETGEVVLALCEWVISKNVKPKDNLADTYMQMLQNNRNQLDTINQSIRKYNQSIEYCRDGHEDMAVMQLKKVVSSNPKLVKAQQLLALLYMKNGEYERARRVLKKAASVDNTNTTTLRYLTEIEEITGKASAFGSRRKRREAQENSQTVPEGGALRYISGTETIIQPTTFRDSSTVATFINIALGILLGGAIVWFMAVPATRQDIQDAANQAVTDANLKLASGTAQLTDLQDQIDKYKRRINNVKKDRDEARDRAEGYEELLGIADLYVKGEQTAAIDAIGKMDSSYLEGNAKALYDDLMANVSAVMFQEYYTTGTTAYAAGDYQTAADQLKAAVEADPEGENTNYFQALYYLGFAYYNLGDYVNSNKYFEMFMERYPNQASQVRPYIVNGADQSTSQGEASMNQGTDTSQDTTQSQGYDPNLVAWTDPNTGLHYDVYGNLLG